MRKSVLSAAALSGLLLTACGGSVTSDCERLFESNKEICDCFADTLNAQLSDSDMDKVRDAMREAENQNQLMAELEAKGVSEQGAVSVMSASKTCEEVQNKSE